MNDSLKKAFVCIFTGCVSFGLVVATSYLLHSHTFEQVEVGGVGGFETPAMPAVAEDIISEVVGEDTESDISLSYISYRVKKGDIIGKIAEKYGVTEDTIISVNNVRSARTIQIGQYLKVPSMAGILYTVKKDGETVESIAKKYKIDIDKCCQVNNMEQAVALNVGSTVFVPDAKLDFLTKQEINGDLFRRPLRSRYYISSNFGWRASPFNGSRSYHTGVDMATSQGTKVYSALAGRVTYVGYNSVFGNHIIIEHHSNYKTLYGHLSATNVIKGQMVTSDTLIGRVGSTGMSTGPHLHFTVYKNNKLVNPVALWQ